MTTTKWRYCVSVSTLSALFLIAFSSSLTKVSGFISPQSHPLLSLKKMSMSATESDGWTELQSIATNTAVGAALNLESESRAKGTGAPFVQNKLRLFNSVERPKLTLYRDHAGWYVRYCYEHSQNVLNRIF